MTAKFNRLARHTATVLAVLAVGAGATACNSSDTASGASSDKGASQSDKSGAKDEAGKSGATAKETAEKGSRTDAVNVASASATASKRCHTGELGFNWGGPHGGAPDMDDQQDAQNASIRVKNNGGRTCTLYGFPGIRLISESGEAWDLRRSGDKPSKITLKPGASTAAISMNLLAVPKDIKDTKPFIPSKVLITPPDETSHVTLKWPYGGAILDQSGATSPGTFVNPITVA